MQLVDLTRPLDAGLRARIPEPARAATQVIAPKVEPIDPATAGAELMCAAFGCTTDDLPDGEGWGDEKLTMNTHIGTHVDAPLHYGTTCEGRPARSITDIALDELVVPAVVLDIAGKVAPGEGIPVEILAEAVDAAGGSVPEGGAALIMTGQGSVTPDDLAFYSYPGMTREGTLWLAEQGAKVLGTDALGWDRPFMVMRQAFRDTGDARQIWDGHFAGRDREVFIVQQLTGLEHLPSRGFTVGFFALPITGASAAPARVVAFLNDGDG